MAETSLHPPDEVYGEYATANGFDLSNDENNALFNETLLDATFDVEIEVLLGVAAVDAGTLSDAMVP